MKRAAALFLIFAVTGSCEPEPLKSLSRGGVAPASAMQIEVLESVLLQGMRVHNVFRIRSDEHRNAWYVAGQVYGTEAIDGDVAVWFVAGAADAPGHLLAVDTMADACSYAPVETDSALSWEDREVRRLEAHIHSRI